MIKKEKSTKSLRFANGIFLGGALLCVVIFTYDLWRSNCHFDKNYFAYVTAFVSCLITLKLKEDSRINLALGLISILLALYALEISLFLWEPTPWKRDKNMEKAAKKAGVPFDIRTKWQVIKDLRKNGVDAYPIVLPHHHLPDGFKSNHETIFPLSSISGKATVLGNESGEYIISMADEYGFINPIGSWKAKQLDLMLIGDSFAQGAGVKPEKDIAGQLRKYGWKIISIGMGGNGPLLELASLKEYAEPIKPKIVLWLYYEDNDLVDFQKEKNSAFIMKYLQNDFSQDLIHRQKEVDLVLRQYVEKEMENYRPYSAIFDVIRLKHIRFKLKHIKFIINKEKFQLPAPDSLFQEILIKAKEEVTTWGGELFFVYLPMWSRYTDKNTDDNQYRRRQEIMNIVRELDITIIDIHEEAFLKHPNPRSLFTFSLYGHYNEKGYEQVAETINKYLNK